MAFALRNIDTFAVAAAITSAQGSALAELRSIANQADPDPTQQDWEDLDQLRQEADEKEASRLSFEALADTEWIEHSEGA